LLGLDNFAVGLGEVVHADAGAARTVQLIHDQVLTPRVMEICERLKHV